MEGTEPQPPALGKRSGSKEDGHLRRSTPPDPIEGVLAIAAATDRRRKQQPHGALVLADRSLNETHLILYVAWRKLWMERTEKNGSVRTLSLVDFHRVVTTEAAQLAIDELRLCSVVPDWKQTVEVLRTLARRGALRFHRYVPRDGSTPKLHVAMDARVGEDMLDSINATIMDQMDAVAQERRQIFDGGGKTEAGGERSQKRRRTERRRLRKKVYYIPPSVLELHLEYERRDLVAEGERFRAEMADGPPTP